MGLRDIQDDLHRKSAIDTVFPCHSDKLVVDHSPHDVIGGLSLAVLGSGRSGGSRGGADTRSKQARDEDRSQRAPVSGVGAPEGCRRSR